MAAIALSRRLLVLMLLAAAALPAQESRAVRERLAHVASALSAGHPQEAMDAFDKSFENYSQLRDYFVGLTDAHSIVNEMEVTEEEIADREATLTVHWTLTLSDLTTGLTESREQDLTVKLTMKKSDWRIVDLSPIEFFNPEPAKQERKPRR
jgi:hypothetical protein